MDRPCRSAGRWRGRRSSRSGCASGVTGCVSRGVALFTVAVSAALELLAQRRAGASRRAAESARGERPLVVVALSYLLAWLHYRRSGRAPDRGVAIGAGAACVAQFVTLVLLTSEIYAYWARPRRTLRARADGLGHVGRLRDRADRHRAAQRYAPIRYFAIALFGLTIAQGLLRRHGGAGSDLPRVRASSGSGSCCC